jgi:putative tryptophan/tyrosine transport system substrate-binding protein
MRGALARLLVVLAAALPAPAAAQDQASRIHRLAVLAPTSAAVRSVVEPAIRHLAEQGFVLGRNLVVDVRSAEGVFDRLPALARELVEGKPDVIVAIAPTAIRAARAATGTVPIMMAYAGEDPVAAGWASSLARPGGNLTGLLLLGPELDAKRLQLAHEALPGVRRFGVLTIPKHPLLSHEANLRALRPVAEALQLELVLAEVAGANERPGADAYAQAIARARADGAQALLVPSSTVFPRDAALIARLATEAGLATVCEWPEMAAAGCMLAYGASRDHLRRRTAHYLARLLGGTPPAELPIEAPVAFELTVNLPVAGRLKADLPPSLIARADEVIE